MTATHQTAPLRMVWQMRGDRVDWARAQAEQFMSTLGRRWAHVQAVAARAASLPFEGGDRELLVAAAYLHDIGYAPGLAATGFHPLDGARHLRSFGEEDLARLVAHHTNAKHEAGLRGIEDYEDEFPFGGTLLDDALTFCDLSTSPDGQLVTIEDRLAEIVERYGPDHVVARTVLAGMPGFERGRERVRRHCAEAGVSL
ncbi:HDIG domain-containing protein [Pedococcus aerophilus]|uniref:HDIG domain-containing protein n=2 Tax=Micrococcales TaxID=85006 RepID=A0ABN3UES9_9MICO